MVGDACGFGPAAMWMPGPAGRVEVVEEGGRASSRLWATAYSASAVSTRRSAAPRVRSGLDPPMPVRADSRARFNCRCASRRPMFAVWTASLALSSAESSGPDWTLAFPLGPWGT